VGRLQRKNVGSQNFAEVEERGNAKKSSTTDRHLQRCQKQGIESNEAPIRDSEDQNSRASKLERTPSYSFCTKSCYGLDKAPEAESRKLE
jgi:hypothetical protein